MITEPVKGQSIPVHRQNCDTCRIDTCYYYSILRADTKNFHGGRELVLFIRHKGCATWQPAPPKLSSTITGVTATTAATTTPVPVAVAK